MRPRAFDCPVTFLDLARKAAARHLPIGHSFIPFDLLLQIFIRSRDQSLEPHNIKSLFASLPYSEMGMRYHLKRLIDSQFVELIKSESDPRVKLIVPTLKTVERFTLITEELSGGLNSVSR